jgi:hypothetical protein
MNVSLEDVHQTLKSFNGFLSPKVPTQLVPMATEHNVAVSGMTILRRLQNLIVQGSRGLTY